MTMATTWGPPTPEIRVTIFTKFREPFRWTCPAFYPTEDLQLDLVAIMLLPLDLEPERLILRKRGKRQPLRDSPTLYSYGIVDGSAVDFEVTGLGDE